MNTINAQIKSHWVAKLIVIACTGTRQSRSARKWPFMTENCVKFDPGQSKVFCANKYGLLRPRVSPVKTEWNYIIKIEG